MKVAPPTPNSLMLSDYRIRDDLDIYVVPHFAQTVLGFDPNALLSSEGEGGRGGVC